MGTTAILACETCYKQHFLTHSNYSTILRGFHENQHPTTMKPTLSSLHNHEANHFMEVFEQGVLHGAPKAGVPHAHQDSHRAPHLFVHDGADVARASPRGAVRPTLGGDQAAAAGHHEPHAQHVWTVRAQREIATRSAFALPALSTDIQTQRDQGKRDRGNRMGGLIMFAAQELKI